MYCFIRYALRAVFVVSQRFRSYTRFGPFYFRTRVEIRCENLFVLKPFFNRTRAGFTAKIVFGSNRMYSGRNRILITCISLSAVLYTIILLRPSETATEKNK